MYSAVCRSLLIWGSKLQKVNGQGHRGSDSPCIFGLSPYTHDEERLFIVGVDLHLHIREHILVFNTVVEVLLYLVYSTGVPRIIHGARRKRQRPRARVGFLGRGQQLPPHQLGSLGSIVSSLSGVRDGAPTAQRFSTIFSTQDGLS